MSDKRMQLNISISNIPDNRELLNVLTSVDQVFLAQLGLNHRDSKPARVKYLAKQAILMLLQQKTAKQQPIQERQVVAPTIEKKQVVDATSDVPDLELNLFPEE